MNFVEEDNSLQELKTRDAHVWDKMKDAGGLNVFE